MPPPAFICARGVFVIHAYKRTSKLFAHPSDSFFQKKSPSPPHGFFKIQFIFLFFDHNMMPKGRLKILVFGILFFSILVQKQKLHFSHYFWKKISLSKMPRHSKICLLVFFLILKKKIKLICSHDFFVYFHHYPKIPHTLTSVFSVFLVPFFLRKT